MPPNPLHPRSTTSVIRTDSEIEEILGWSLVLSLEDLGRNGEYSRVDRQRDSPNTRSASVSNIGVPYRFGSRTFTRLFTIYSFGIGMSGVELLKMVKIPEGHDNK